MKGWKVAGVGFDHMHMGDLLRMVHGHERASICGMLDSHPERMSAAARSFGVAPDRCFTDLGECMEKAAPDIVILCSTSSLHREWVEKLAPYGVHVLVEKPFATNLSDADAMISAMATSGKRLAINWPMAWYPSHVMCKKLIEAGTIGEPLEVHYYGGNRGPLYHLADKALTDFGNSLEEKRAAWWYHKSEGGGSMQDYLGYGVTLGTWFLDGQIPLEVTAMTDRPEGLEVDEHSITIARYANGLSKFETRWGTFTDPWTHQPQPKCGFIMVGSKGTISSFDLEQTVRVQDSKHPEGYDQPVDALLAPYQNPIQYFIHCLESNQPFVGPLSPAISRIGQRIVDTAVLSASVGRAMPLVGEV